MTDSQNLFSTAQALPGALASLGSAPVIRQLRHLVDNGLADLPAPGTGRTLERWQALSLVARHDLSLARLYEGHVDALAILRELGGAQPTRGEVWAMWAAESPGRSVTISDLRHSSVSLSGSKAWCPGALGASHALVTAWLPGQQPQLVAVELDHPSVTIQTDAWHPAGMADTGNADVMFNGTPGVLLGSPGDFLHRRGFWHSAAGISACWYGAMCALAEVLYTAVQQSSPTHPSHGTRAAALGRVDVAMASTAALLHQAAAWVDAHPHADAAAVALRARQGAAAGARRVLEEVGRALEATPFSRNPSFMRMASDLPIFMRQSQGERDDATLATSLLSQELPAWSL
ncbi:MAG: acyl-CoA dehydrogenase [Pseudomonadota bacterium]